MLGLAIESANREASAALWRWDNARRSLNIVDQGKLPPENGKADQLITIVEEILSRQDLEYRDLDLLAVNRGPGSFTGIRSAVALVRGLALATGLPVHGITSHEALAAELGGDDDGGSSLIALDARRGEVYVQVFGEDGRPKSDIEGKAPAIVATELGAGRWRLAGSGARLILDHCADRTDIRVIEMPPLDACMVARASAARQMANQTAVSGFELRPLYVRAPDAVPPTPLVGGTPSRSGPKETSI